MPIQPKNSAAVPQLQRPPGKDIKTIGTTGYSGASQRLLKKALRQLSPNSPRAIQCAAHSFRKSKPFVSPATASALEQKVSPLALPSTQEGGASIESSTATAPESDPTSEVLALAGAVSTSDKDTKVAESSAVGSELNAKDVAPGKGAFETVAPTAETTEVRRRTSMMVATVNPRLQEVSVLPRGTVVRVKLFAEDNEEKETIEGQQHVQNAAETTDVEDETAAATPALSAAKEYIEQQQQGVNDLLKEGGPGPVEPQQQKEETASDPPAKSVVAENIKQQQQEGADDVVEGDNRGAVEPEQQQEKNVADVPALSRVMEDIKQQQQKGIEGAMEEDGSGASESQQQLEENVADPPAISIDLDQRQEEDTDDAMEEGRPTAVESQQQAEQPASMKSQHEESEAEASATAAKEEDTVEASRVAMSTGSARTEEQQVATPAPSLLSNEEQDKDVLQDEIMAGLLIEKMKDEQQQEKLASSVLCGGEHVSMAKETATAAVDDMEEHQEDECMGNTLMSSSYREEDIDDEDDNVLVTIPKKDDYDVGVTCVSQPEEVVVAAGEESKVVDVMPQHAESVVDEETKRLVEGSKYLQFEDDERSVLCTLTGKKMAPVYDTIILYIGSRKVQRLMVEGPFVMSVSIHFC